MIGLGAFLKPVISFIRPLLKTCLCGKFFILILLCSGMGELSARTRGDVLLPDSTKASVSKREVLQRVNDTYPDISINPLYLQEQSNDTVVVRLKADCIPPYFNPGTGGEVCGLSFTFNANTPSDLGFWTKESGSGNAVFTDQADEHATVTVNNYGVYKFNWMEIDGPCLADSTITVIFSQNPNAKAGDGGTSCGKQYQLNASYSVIGSTGNWSKASGPGDVQFDPSNDAPDATVTVSEAGNYRFTWTEFNGLCSDQDNVDVLFLEQPKARVNDIGEVCDLNVQLDAIPSVGTGHWEMVLGAGTSEFEPNAFQADPEVNVNLFGAYVFKWTEENGICTDDTSITIAFKLQPTANPGKGGDACGMTFQLNAVLSSGSGSWSKKSGPGDVSFFPNELFRNAQAQVTEYGTYELTWTESNGNCSDDSSIVVNYYEPPVADAGEDGFVCGNTFDLSAQASVGAGEWRMLTGPGVASFAPGFRDPEAALNVTEYGIYRLQWTETNGSCSDSDTLEIRFYEQPIADAGGNGESCDLFYNLNGKVNAGTGEWTKVSGPGSISFAPDANTGDARVSVSDYGIYELKWTVVNGDCMADSVISLAFYEQPEADAGTGGTVCGLWFQLNATPSSGVGTWEKISGPGTVSFEPDQNAPDATVVASEEGTYVLKWVETNGFCADEEEVTVIFYDQPVPNPGKDDSICGTSVQLNAIPSAGTGEWRQTGGPGTAFFAPSTDRPDVQVAVSDFGAYTFTWTETNGPCSEDSSIVINFLEIPVADPGRQIDVCGLNAVMAAELSSGSGTWRQVSGPSTIDFMGDEENPEAQITVALFGDYVLRWTETNGICSDDSTVLVRFMESIEADPGEIGKPCGLEYTFNAPLNGGAGKWTRVSGPGDVRFTPDETDPNATMIVDIEGSYEINWSVSNGSCSDDSTFQIQFYRQPVATLQMADEICGTEVIADVTMPFGTGTWQQTAGVGDLTFQSLEQEAGAMIAASDFGDYVLKWEVRHGHCSDDTLLNISFIEPPIADPGQGGEVCGNTHQLNAEDGPGNGKWEKVSGPGDIRFVPDDARENPEIHVSAYGHYELRWTESNGICQKDSIISLVFYEQFDAGILIDDTVCGVNAVLVGNDVGSPGEWVTVEGASTGVFENAEALTSAVQVDTPGTFRFGWVVGESICKDTATNTVVFKPTANLVLSDDVQICEGSTVTLTASSNAPVNWEPGVYISDPTANQQLVAPIENTLFRVSSEAENGCVDSAEVHVIVDKQPAADAGPDQELNYQFYTSLEAELPLVGTGSWMRVDGTGNLGDEASTETDISGLSVGENIFRWTVINGVCPEASDEVTILVNDLFIPNVMTPNGDGKNDYFVINGLENMGENKLFIFNRWGNEVYKTDNYYNDWDGKDQDGNNLPADTYFYIIELKEESTLKGYISIKR